MKTSALVSLRYVVSSVLNELRLDDKDYEFLMQLAIDGYTDINIFASKNTEIRYDTVSTINTINMPSDLIDVKSLGIIKGNDIWTLTEKNSIPLARSRDCGEDTNPYSQKSTSGDSIYEFSERNGDFTDVYLGSEGGNNKAYYRKDWDYRRIVFQGDLTGEDIVMEYISSGVNLSGDTVIPRQWVTALKKYVHWMNIENDSRVPMNEKERKKMQYGDAKREAHSFDVSFSLDELMDVRRSTFKRGPKR